VSDHLRPPFDDHTLDAYWDALNRGELPSVQLPPDVALALRHLASLDPAPQSSTVRERAWAETWKRIRPIQSNQEHSVMHAIPVSSNHRLPQSRLVPDIRPPAATIGHIDRRWAVIAVSIVAFLLAFVAYAILGPPHSDPANGPVIPAAVVQDATPAAAPAGEHKLTIDLPASMVHSTGAISAGWDYIEFPANRSYTYTGNCCPGPFIEYVLTGQLTVQSDAPMTIFRADGTSEPLLIGHESTLLPGDAFLAENDAKLVATNNGEELAQLLGWVLVDDARFNGHEMGGFATTLDVDLEFDMAVNPGPGQVIVTRYDRLGQIPKPGPNSYQFVLLAYHTPSGQASVRSEIRDPKGTPVAGDDYDGYYVLDFLMSPPGTPSPTAGTPAA
jgi:hypothetical protein